MTSAVTVLIANSTDATITAYRLDKDALHELATTPLPGSCSTFAVDAKRGLVYAGVKQGPGMDGPALLTLQLDKQTGALTEVARRSCPGAMTYLVLTPGADALLGVSYSAGLGISWPVVDGEVQSPVSELGYPNLHCIRVSGDGRHAYAVSLGADLVAQYALDGATLTPLDPPSVALPEGSGPRHLVLHDSDAVGYLVTEFSGEVFRLGRDVASGRLTVHEAISIVDPAAGLQRSRLGADPVAEGLIWGADVHIAREGEYLLATERNASTIASVALAGGGRLNQVVHLRPTQRQPRGFQVTADGTRAIVVGEKDTQAMLYRITPTGELTELATAPTGAGANWVRVVLG